MNTDLNKISHYMQAKVAEDFQTLADALPDEPIPYKQANQMVPTSVSEILDIDALFGLGVFTSADARTRMVGLASGWRDALSLAFDYKDTRGTRVRVNPGHTLKYKQEAGLSLMNTNTIGYARVIRMRTLREVYAGGEPFNIRQAANNHRLQTRLTRALNEAGCKPRRGGAATESSLINDINLLVAAGVLYMHFDDHATHDRSTSVHRHYHFHTGSAVLFDRHVVRRIDNRWYFLLTFSQAAQVFPSPLADCSRFSYALAERVPETRGERSEPDGTQLVADWPSVEGGVEKDVQVEVQPIKAAAKGTGLAHAKVNTGLTQDMLTQLATSLGVSSNALAAAALENGASALKSGDQQGASRWLTAAQSFLA